ncbi:MAG: PLD nuclease N-terminal domain-containing protein [Rhodothermales bacterium]
MLTKGYRLLSVTLCGLAAVLLTGCGGPNLFERIDRFWSFGCLGTIVVVLDIIALIEVAGSSRSLADKLLWAVLIIIFPVLGCILYYFFGRK